MMDAQHHRRGKGRVRHLYAMSCAAAAVLPYLPAAIRYDLFAKRSHVVRTWPACSAHARPRLHVCLSRPPAPTQVRQLPGKLLRSGRPGGLRLRGSHGSGHAELPHPALRPTASLRGGGENLRLRKADSAPAALPFFSHVMWARCERRFNHLRHTPQTRWRKSRSALQCALSSALFGRVKVPPMLG